MSIWNALKPFLARLVGTWIAALALWLYGKFGVELSEQTITELVAGLLAIFGTIYSIVHRLVSKKLNPVDAATKPLALEGQRLEKEVQW